MQPPFVRTVEDIFDISMNIESDYSNIASITQNTDLVRQGAEHATEYSENILRLKCRLLIILMSRLHADNLHLAQEAEYQRHTPQGSTTAPSLYAAPLPRFDGDEPRLPPSDSSVVGDMPLPDLIGGTIGEVPPWRGSSSAAPPFDSIAEPRP